nr:hypothetical protein [Tanacetum cinerariifolium]
MKGESLASMYERMTTLLNVMDRNKVRSSPIFVNTKFLNSWQPEWNKYVTMTRQRYNLMDAAYDQLYDSLSQFEPHVQVSKAKKPARNHDPLALVAHLNVHSSFSCKNQAVIHDGRVDIQSKNVGYIGNGNRNAGRQNINQEGNAGNGLVQQIEENDQIYYKADAKPKYDAEAISEVNASQINLISGMLSKEAENQQRMNNELKKQKLLLQKELETCKEHVRTLEKKPVQSLNYKEAYKVLEREISVEKDKIKRLLKEKDKIQGVASSSSVRRPESKQTNLKKRVLLNTKSKSTSINVKKISSSVSVVSNKSDTLNSTVCQSNTSVIKAKTVNVLNDGSNLGKKSLIHFPVAAKSRNLGATYVVAKSRLVLLKSLQQQIRSIVHHHYL